MGKIFLTNPKTGGTLAVDSTELEKYKAQGYQADTPVTVADEQGYQSNVAPEQLPYAPTNEAPVSPVALGNEQAKARQVASFDNMGDKAFTFAEGAVDALSFGLIHERGDEADLRRDVDSGSALLGELAGTAIGLKLPGPTKWFSEGGEAAGSAAAKSIFGTEGRTAELASRAMREAGAGGVLMAAGAAGHQIFDAVIDNKPIAVEAIFSEAGMGALLGGGFGLMGGIFGRAASRGAVAEGANLENFSRVAGDTFNQAATEMYQAVSVHEARIGFLQEAADRGLIDAGLLEGPRAALKTAQKASEKLAELGDVGDILGGTSKERAAWQKAAEDLDVAVQDLDSNMKGARAKVGLNATPAVEPGLPIQGPHPDVESMPPKISGMTDEARGLNERMAASPELQAKYQELHGRPWEAVGNFESPVAADAGEANLGGKLSETSEQATGVSRKPRAVTPAPAPEPEPTGGVQSDKSLAEAFAGHLETAPRGEYNPRTKGQAETDALYGEDSKGLKGARQAGHAHPEGEPVYPPEATREPGFGKPPRTPKPKAPVEPKDLKGAETTAHAHPQEDVRPFGHGEERVRVHRQMQELMNSWDAEARNLPSVSPGDRASYAIDRHLADLQLKTEGRLDSASGLGFDAKKLGLPPSKSNLGSRFQQAVAVHEATALAGEAAKGGKSLLGKSMDFAKRRVAGKAGAALLGGVLGSTVGGSMGFYLGAAMAGNYAAFTGKLSGSVSRIATKIAKAGDALLSGVKPRVYNAAINRPWAYSDRGPLEKPLDRIQDLQHVAAHPELIAQRIASSTGDLAVVHPEVFEMMVTAAQDRLVKLSIRAPKIVWDKLGEPLSPEANSVRRFLEYENAAHDLEGTLDAVARGQVTRIQAESLREQWPAHHTALSARLLNDPSQLRSLTPTGLRNVELITGAPLTGLMDGPALQRQQTAWTEAHNAQPDLPAQAQSFKIGANSRPPSENPKNNPATRPTPSQSASSGRAPGN